MDGQLQQVPVIEVGPADIYQDQIARFLHERGLHRIVAFCGGSDEQLEGVEDKELQTRYAEVMAAKQATILQDALSQFQGFRVAILTGGTEGGVPERAARIAKRLGLATIGVMPAAGIKFALGCDSDTGQQLLDLKIVVHPSTGESAWGDESPVLTKLLDGAIVYGGSSGTLIEIAHLLKMNDKRLKKGETPKFIVPISGSGGVADGLPFVWSKPTVLARSMPKKLITSGQEAARFLIDNLDVEFYV